MDSAFAVALLALGGGAWLVDHARYDDWLNALGVLLIIAAFHVGRVHAVWVTVRSERERPRA